MWALTEGICTPLPWVLQREGRSQSAWEVTMYPVQGLPCLLWALHQFVEQVNECEKQESGRSCCSQDFCLQGKAGWGAPEGEGQGWGGGGV